MPLKLMTTDVLVSTNFFIEITGETISNITSVDGLHVEVEVADVTQRTTKGVFIQHKILAKPKLAGTFTFKRIQPNTIGTDPIWKWFLTIRTKGMSVASRNKLRKSGSLVGYDSTMTEKSRWNFTEAWPSKIEVDGFDVEKNDPIHETVTMQYESLIRSK